MKPIWIADDDQSIRFVLEKALQREGLPTRSFTGPRDVLQALDADDGQGGPQVLVEELIPLIHFKHQEHVHQTTVFGQVQQQEMVVVPL